MLDNPESASESCKLILKNGLPDENRLKPTVWAEHQTRKECFGVSLGVAAFVRSLYLHIKLSQLRNGNQDVQLEDVIARTIPRGNDNQGEDRDPCKSCKIFFTDRSERTGSIFNFGNCAEYDVIQSPKLNSCLNSEEVANLWAEVKLACQGQLNAFKLLSSKLDGHEGRREMLNTYYMDTNGKVLKYAKNATGVYTLRVKVWHQ